MNSRNPIHVPKVNCRAGSTLVQSRSCSSTPILESHLALLKDGTFSDVTFIVGPSKERIQCHQLFLKARSTVFEVMFSERWNQDSSKEVSLKDTDPKIFRTFLEFMYSDAFVANVTQALELLQVAHKYDVQLLVSKCEKLLESEVTLDDAVDVFQAARKYDKTQLMDKVGNLMAKSLSKLQSLSSFSRVDKQTLIYILKRSDLKMKEVDLFRLAVQWEKNQLDWTAKFILQDILPLIRFPLMTLNEFTSVVVPTGLLSQSTLVELFTYFGSDTAAKNSLARTLKYSTQPRKSVDSIIVALYPGDIANMNTRRQQFQGLKECLQFVLRTNYSQTRPAPYVLDDDGDNKTSFGLKGITIYCPSREQRTASATVTASFRKFKILVRAGDYYENSNGVSSFQHMVWTHAGKAVTGASQNFKEYLSMPSVEVEEGKITDTKFDNVVTLENQEEYCISVEEMKPCTPAHLPSYSYEQDSYYNTTCFGNHLNPATVEIDQKTVSIRVVLRNHLKEFQHSVYTAPQLIYKFRLEEL